MWAIAHLINQESIYPQNRIFICESLTEKNKKVFKCTLSCKEDLQNQYLDILRKYNPTKEYEQPSSPCLFCSFEQVEVLAAIQLMWTCYTHPPIHSQKESHNSGISISYSSRIVCIQTFCETEPTVYSPYPRRLESLNHLRM